MLLLGLAVLAAVRASSIADSGALPSTTKSSVETCRLPKLTGPCRAAISRWYFDPKTSSCTRFTYGGCGGNGNNFESRDECVVACASKGPCRPRQTDPNGLVGFLGTFSPKCTETGHFAITQCSEGRCWCVDPLTGAEVADSAVSGAGNPTCPPCHALIAAGLSAGEDLPSTSCDAQGLFTRVQCRSDNCWCVDPQSGAVQFGTRVEAARPSCEGSEGLQFRSTNYLDRATSAERKNADPTTTAPPQPGRVGACKAQLTGCIGATVSQCTERGDFSVEQCSGSTGFCWCVDPESGIEAPGSRTRGRPDCRACHQEKALTLSGPRDGFVGVAIPRCDQFGDYHPIQCNPSTGYCWCGDVGSGAEVPGTRAAPGTVPDCGPSNDDATVTTPAPVQGSGPCSARLGSPLQCSPSGYFSLVQCSGRECWCSDVTSGRELAETRSSVGRPACPVCHAAKAALYNNTAPLIGAFVPQCHASGFFERMQCHGSSGSCWCVEPRSGAEMDGTRRRLGEGLPECRVFTPRLAIFNNPRLFEELPDLSDPGLQSLCQGKEGTDCNSAAASTDFPSTLAPHIQSDSGSPLPTTRMGHSQNEPGVYFPAEDADTTSTAASSTLYFSKSETLAISTRMPPDGERVVPKFQNPHYILNYPHNASSPSPKSEITILSTSPAPTLTVGGYSALFTLYSQPARTNLATRLPVQTQSTNLPSHSTRVNTNPIIASTQFTPASPTVTNAASTTSTIAATGHDDSSPPSTAFSSPTYSSSSSAAHGDASSSSASEVSSSTTELSSSTKLPSSMKMSTSTEFPSSTEFAPSTASLSSTVSSPSPPLPLSFRMVDLTSLRVGWAGAPPGASGFALTVVGSEAKYGRVVRLMRGDARSFLLHHLVPLMHYSLALRVLGLAEPPPLWAAGEWTMRFFERIQCSERECWCVDPEQGLEVMGTREPKEVGSGRSASCPECVDRKADAFRMGAPPPGAFVYACSPNGSYSQLQCHSSTGQCWCVAAETGQEVPGTRAGPTDPVPSCGIDVLDDPPVGSSPSKPISVRIIALTDTPSTPTSTPSSTTTSPTTTAAPSTTTRAPTTTSTSPPSSPRRPGSQCVVHRAAGQRSLLLGAFVPECAPDGRYAPVQCHGSTGHCWCVEVDSGVEVPGSRLAPAEPLKDRALHCGQCREELEAVALGRSKRPEQLPLCDQYGDYMPLQCNIGEGICLCVTPDEGLPIPGTLTSFSKGTPKCQDRASFARAIKAATQANTTPNDATSISRGHEMVDTSSEAHTSPSSSGRPVITSSFVTVDYVEFAPTRTFTQAPEGSSSSSPFTIIVQPEHASTDALTDTLNEGPAQTPSAMLPKSPTSPPSFSGPPNPRCRAATARQGDCPKALRYAYDAETAECLALSSQSCGDVGNLFKTERDCVDACKYQDGSGCYAEQQQGVVGVGSGESGTCRHSADCPSGFECRRGAFFGTCCNITVQELYRRNYAPECPLATIVVRLPSSLAAEFSAPLLGRRCADGFCPTDAICRQGELFAFCCRPSRVVRPSQTLDVAGTIASIIKMASKALVPESDDAPATLGLDSAVRHLRAETLARSLILTWIAPRQAMAVKEYRISYRVSASEQEPSIVGVSGRLRSVRIGGLLPDTDYEVWMTAARRDGATAVDTEHITVRTETEASSTAAPQNDVVRTRLPSAACLLTKAPTSSRLCDSAFRRSWYHDAELSRCLAFRDGGCAGNANNFHSRQECEAACSHSDTTCVGNRDAYRETASGQERLCRIEADCPADWTCKRPSGFPGRCCNESIETLFAQSASPVCSEGTVLERDEVGSPLLGRRCGDEFCAGGEADCRQGPVFAFCCAIQEVASRLRSPSASVLHQHSSTTTSPRFQVSSVSMRPPRLPAFDDVSDDASELCSGPAVRGNCTGRSLAWYFDAGHGECLAFSYSGCGGGLNRFDSREACMGRCGAHVACSGGAAPLGFPPAGPLSCGVSSAGCPSPSHVCRLGAFFGRCCPRDSEESYSAARNPGCPPGSVVVGAGPSGQPLLGASCAADFCPGDSECHEGRLFAFCCSPSSL